MTTIESTRPENYELWLQSLESHDAPEQMEGHLGNDDGARCCLGVACDLSGVERNVDPSIPSILIWDGFENLLPTSVVRWLGLPLPDWWNSDGVGGWDLLLDIPGEYDVRDAESLAMNRYLTASIMNDSGFTFKQIAQTIRYFGIQEMTEG